MVKYLIAQDTGLRFQWEIDVLLTNLYSLDAKADVVLLFAVKRADDPYLAHTVEKWGDRASIHAYMDTRGINKYVAATRPFLWYCYLAEDPKREQDTYLQLDSDVIFRELPDYTKMADGSWYGSDCHVYMDYEYLRTRTNGESIVDNFARIMGIDRSVIEQTEGAGAQWLLVKPTADYWLKVQSDCHKLSDYLDRVDSDIQKWCAEMWAQLLNAPLFGAEYKVSSELDFCNPLDPPYRWKQAKILHNSGVASAEQKSQAMDKNAFRERTPFGADFSWVDKDRCTVHYVDAINKVMV